MRARSALSLVALLSLLPACGEELREEEPLGELDDHRMKSEDGKADASAAAVFLQFEFDGEVTLQSSYDPQKDIENHLLYTVGPLNGEESLGRLDRLVLTNIQSATVDGKTRLTYHATLPVAWGRREAVPAEFTFRLPRDGSYSGLEAFTAKYKSSCVDWHAHDVDSGIMWYYYRPAASGCTLDPADVVDVKARVSPSSIGTTGKFPEYTKIWADGELRVVAVFGKFEDHATTGSDAGIAGFNSFVRTLRSELASLSPTTIPAQLPAEPGVGTPDITFRATLPGGKKIEIVALLVDNVRSAGAAFDTRYGQLSTRADLIAYNGHSGLGANIRALARKGQWVAGQYVIVFMNGCDTYAYVDSALFDAHAKVNPDDPQGTKHTDVVMNAMPSFFSSMPEATLAIVRGLMKHDAPMTYEQIFTRVDSSQVVLVSGEEDNEFVPGGGGGGGDTGWPGLEQSGALKRDAEARFETPKLAAGRYLFTTTGTGDVDLYVRIGSAPTKKAYDCRPYLGGSKESCAVELPSAGTIHVMVRGYGSSSTYTLSGKKQ